MLSKQLSQLRFTHLGSLCLLALVACQPVTISHVGRIDFERYRSVYVEPISLSGNTVFPDLDTGTQLYLVDELRLISGFRTVNAVSTLQADTILAVTMQVDADEDFETGDVEYRAEVSFQLLSARGGLIASETFVSRDADLLEAQQDALDEIALFFLKPYRI